MTATGRTKGSMPRPRVDLGPGRLWRQRHEDVSVGDVGCATSSGRGRTEATAHQHVHQLAIVRADRRRRRIAPPGRVVSRLGRVDPEATGTEHAAVDDAHAQARFDQDTVQIDLYGPEFLPEGRRLRVEEYEGISTTLVRRSGETVYSTKCRLRGFGDKTLVLAYVSEPARSVPAVHRALRCLGKANR